MLASVGIGHQNSPLFTMYLSVGADGGGYTISVPIKMRSLSCAAGREGGVRGWSDEWSFAGREKEAAPLPLPLAL